MKTLLKLAFAAILLTASVAIATEPLCEHTPTLEVPAYKIVKVKAPDVDPKAALVWRVYPSENVSKADSPRGLLQFTAPPGDYKVELLILTPDKDGNLQTQEFDVQVRILSAGPPKVDPPKPKEGSGKPDPAKALAKMSFPPYGCTATVIGPRRADGKWDVLSAAHCVSHVSVGSKGAMQMLDGRKFSITVVAVDPKCDVSWLVTDDASVTDMPYANLASENPAVGTAIWHAGYGVDKPGNREDGSVAGGEDGNGQINMKLSVSSGDSGGGIFRSDTNELISVVCCTTAKGQRASVWGCSANAARQRRPVTAQTFKWEPIEIPILQISRP